MGTFDVSKESRLGRFGTWISHEQASPKIIQWPNQPQRLQSGWARPSELLINAFSLLLVGLLIVYIAFLLVFDGAVIENVEAASSFLREISQLGPTIIPITFAFIVGRAIRAWAHYRLQEGERIGMLDMLYGSTTFTSTVSAMLELRRFGFLELFLLLVWSLSPLGGQAILRVLSFQQVGLASELQMEYLNMSTPFPRSFVTSDYGGLSIPVQTAFLASVGAPDTTQNSSMDTWGNIKIPMLESLNGTNASTEGWISLGVGNNAPAYSSLVGVPVSNIPEGENTTFSLETSYMNLDCSVLQQVPSAEVPKLRNQMNTIGANNRSTCGGCGVTFLWGTLATLPTQEGINGSSRCNDTNPVARTLTYFSFDADGEGGTFANCTLTTTYVELQVACRGQSCQSTAMRPSAQTATRPSANRTMLDYCPGAGNYPIVFPYFAQIIGAFSGWGGSQSSGSPSALQVYLADPAQTLNVTAPSTIPPLYTLGRELFSARLTQILNTHWVAAVGKEAIFLGHPPSYDDLAQTTGNEVLFSRADAQALAPATIIHCNRGWLAPLVLSTIVMLAAAALTLAVELRVWVPRVLMNVSTAARGNPAFGLPAGGGVLSDEARSRLLRDVRVRFGDGGWSGRDGTTAGDVHDLVLGDCAEDGGRVEPVRRDRLYI